MGYRRIHVLVVALWLLAMLLAACAAEPEEAAEPSPMPTAPQPTVQQPTAPQPTVQQPVPGGESPLPTPTPAGSESPLPTPTPAAGAVPGTSGVAVVDALGRSVQFEALPERIVSAGRSGLTIIETLFLFPEARERVVAMSVGQQKPGEFLSLVDAGYGQKQEIAPDSGPEQIAPLRPDAVVLRSFMADTLGAALGQVGMPAIYLDLETPEQYFRDVATLGQLLGNETRAREIQDFYQERLDAISGGLEGLDPADKPRVLLVQHSDQGGEVSLEVPSAAWLQTLMVELAGGEPVWREAALGGGWSVVNLEQIAAWNPDQIYVISYKADPATVVEELRADPRWQELAAVQADQIYGFPGEFFSWDQPDPRWILGVTWLATKMHPERLADLDMTQEITDFFGEMYGLDEATVTAEILPRLRGNVE
jgi:iron complex transport system substrate-binding protein